MKAPLSNNITGNDSETICSSLITDCDLEILLKMPYLTEQNHVKVTHKSKLKIIVVLISSLDMEVWNYLE